jgi:hypothetical protein
MSTTEIPSKPGYDMWSVICLHRSRRLMSFNLPRNSKDLRFTGELRAAIDDQPKAKLGIPRSRKTPQPGRSAHSPDVYRADPIPTPFAPPPIEVIDLGDDDDSPTTMLDREGLDVLPGGFGAPRHKPEANRRSPVPNFRTPPGMPKVIVARDSKPTVPGQQRAKSPPLVFWLVAALVLAIVSFKVTPVMVAKAEIVAKRVQAL